MDGKQNMKKNKFLYNNEGIALVAVMSILFKMKELEYSKVFLILPFLLNDNITAFAKNKNSTIIGIQDLISRRITSFSNFNKSYKNFYPLTFNTISLAEELNLIKIDSGSIVYLENDFDLSSESLGTRAANIVLASSKIQTILNIDDLQLYSSLKIRL